jgi:hypothetical protein
MRAIRAVLRFCYEFVVGDDPKIAIAVVLALGITGAALLLGLPSAPTAVLGAILLGACFTTTMVLNFLRD